MLSNLVPWEKQLSSVAPYRTVSIFESLRPKQQRDQDLRNCIQLGELCVCVHYKLALIKIIANDWTKAYAICLYRD